MVSTHKWNWKIPFFFLFTVTKFLLLEERHLLHQKVVRQEVVRRQNRLNAGHFYRQLGSGVSSSSVPKD